MGDKGSNPERWDSHPGCYGGFTWAMKKWVPFSCLGYFGGWKPFTVLWGLCDRPWKKGSWIPIKQPGWLMESKIGSFVAYPGTWNCRKMAMLEIDDRSEKTGIFSLVPSTNTNGCFKWITRWFQTFFYFHPYLGKIPNLTNIFQVGWNHQLEIFFLGKLLEITKHSSI